MSNIHSQALFTLGLKVRLDKLRKEATELANAIDRMDEGKATFDDVLHEFRDCFFIWESVMESHQFEEASRRRPWSEHEKDAREKLLAAIADSEHFVDDIAGDGD